MNLVICADFGSTFTKALLVSLDDAAVVAAVEHRTTIETDVLEGYGTCRDTLVRVQPAAARAPVLACSSAGGGLRIAVVGNEELVTAEAGRRVALSSGGRVVHVGDGGLDGARLHALRGADPDVVLLVGGTDGGDADVVIAAAQTLGGSSWPVPVVAAGNVEAADTVGAALRSGGVPYELADNVVPRIGVLAPQSARAAIRSVFLRHVIGGKQLSASTEFVAMVAGPTPDVVLAGTEVLAELAGDVAVVDVGGATTDVHSVVEVDAADGELARQVVAPTRVTRTVEGDLGMRWSAVSTVQRGTETGLVSRQERPALVESARARLADPGLLPAGSDAHADDRRIAEVALGLALRRHGGRQRLLLGPGGRVVERSGKDLREVDLLVGSGGVLRHSDRAVAEAMLRTGTGDDVPGGWLLPRAPRISIDQTYVLAAVGLLAPTYPDVARALARRHLLEAAAGG